MLLAYRRPCNGKSTEWLDGVQYEGKGMTVAATLAKVNVGLLSDRYEFRVQTYRNGQFAAESPAIATEADARAMYEAGVAQMVKAGLVPSTR